MYTIWTFGACSKYAKYGWVDGLNPTSYVGMQITYNRSDDSDADFNTTRVGVSGKLNVHNLDVWGVQQVRQVRLG